MKKTLVLAVTLGLFAAACGDDSGSGNNADAGVDGHGSDGGPADTMPPAFERAVVANGDFNAAGLLSEANVDAKTIRTNVAPATSVGKDPFMRKFGDKLFIVNRDTGNSVTILAASDYSLVQQVATGTGSNPYDVAVVGDKVYVAEYAKKGLLTFTLGSSTTTEIDLSADDTDGVPNCGSVYAVGTKVFVACQILDENFTPRGPGKVYVVDSATNTKSATLTMDTENPFGVFQQIPAGADHAGDLIIGTTDFSATGGCIERVTTGATPTAEGCLIDNADLGGYVTDVAFSGTDAYGVVNVPGANFTSNGEIRMVALVGGAISATPLTPAATQNIVDVAVCPSGKIVVTDKAKAAADAKGIRIYSSTGTELTTAPLDIGQKPGSTLSFACY